MNSGKSDSGYVLRILTSSRIALTTMAVCSLLYPLIILGLGQALAPHTANGSLIRNDEGIIVGSKVIAQKFERPEYFWPRPSAVDYDASATGGSNLSPANPRLRDRAEAILSSISGPVGQLIPADLVTASGSGIDPDISVHAAEFQAPRVAEARGMQVSTVIDLLAGHAKRPGGALTPEPLINVLQVNMALDSLSN